MPLFGLLTLLAWWLKTWRSERLRPALVFLIEYVPMFAIGAASIGLCVYLEERFKWSIAFAAAMAFMFAIVIPWYRWAYPLIVRALLQASRGALRAGVAVLGIVVTVLATGGVWAFVITPP